MNRLEGFAVWKGKFAILVSQPFIVGRNATGAKIGDFFRNAGFLRICHGTWFRQEEPLAVFDAGKSNLILTHDGLPVPVGGSGCGMRPIKDSRSSTKDDFRFGDARVKRGDGKEKQGCKACFTTRECSCRGGFRDYFPGVSVRPCVAFRHHSATMPRS